MASQTPSTFGTRQREALTDLGVIAANPRPRVSPASTSAWVAACSDRVRP
jgi:hypothetical protein